MYLENIFVGSEDIRKQLPQESLMFDGVNKVFQQSMAQLHAVGNVIQATNAPNVLTTFQVRALRRSWSVVPWLQTGGMIAAVYRPANSRPVWPISPRCCCLHSPNSLPAKCCLCAAGYGHKA